jgi:microcompartment protein CcmL/EutN
METFKEAIGLLEFNSIAKGIFISDAVLKKAYVEIIQSFPVCPGKYLILFHGDEASVLESLNEGKNLAREFLVDHLYLPNVHRDVLKGIIGSLDTEYMDSLGIIETFSCASCIVASDIARKMARVFLIEIRLAMGIGGKAFFTITGEHAEVEAALQGAKDYAEKKGMLANWEIIPSPHEGLKNIVF